MKRILAILAVLAGLSPAARADFYTTTFSSGFANSGNIPDGSPVESFPSPEGRVAEKDVVSMRFKFVGGIASAALAFAAWWFIRPQPDAPLLEPPQVTRSELLPAPAAALPHRVITPSVAAAPKQSAPVEPQPTDPVPNPEPLNERT